MLSSSLSQVLILVLLLALSPLAAAKVASAETPGQGSLPTLLIEPNDGFGAVYSFIAEARRSVDVEMYELDDVIAEQELVADAHRGIAVRVLLDRACSGASYNEPAYRYLAAHGVPVRWAPSSTVVHEKAIVVDGTTTLIATFNLGDTSDYYTTTRDFGVFDSTPADVRAIESVFDSDWSGAPITEPPSSEDGTDLVWSPDSEPALAAVIASARRGLLVENEEMSDSSIISDLEAAARRGVNVEVVMTEDRSWNAAFDGLSRAGVHVATYASAAAPYIHAKVMVADPGTAEQQMFLGSENFSAASLDYNRELGLVRRSGSLIAEVARTVRSDFAGAAPWRTG